MCFEGPLALRSIKSRPKEGHPRTGARATSTRRLSPRAVEGRVSMTAGLDAMAMGAEPSAAPSSASPSPSRPSLSLVVPCFNEEENVMELVEECFRVLRGTGMPFEMVVVDDGSRD